MKNPKHDTPPQQNEPIPFQEALQGLMEQDVHLYAHGTSTEELAKIIMTEGLGLTKPALSSTTYGLERTDHNPNALKDNMRVIRRWPHRNYPFVIIIGVERLAADNVPHARYTHSIVQPTGGKTDDGIPSGWRYTVSPCFVAGYFDVDADSFFPNPDFNSTYDPALLETTPEPRLAMEQLNARGIGAVALEDETIYEDAGQDTLTYVDADDDDDDDDLLWPADLVKS